MVKPGELRQIIEELNEELIQIRRHLHANPELSFKEYNTSDFIASVLGRHNIEFTQGMVKTGIVGMIKGKNPESRVVALRADIDALPIKEKNEVSYASVNDGVMHACGHDVHSTCLLGAAIALHKLRDNFEGSVKLIFQPGEEKLPGGASLMIKEGVLKNPRPDCIFGQHVFPDLEVGKVGFRPGKYMASTDEIYLKIKGKGGHAALPQNITDSVLIASHVVVALQQIVSRNAHPLTPSVLSFGKIIGEGATNVIPEEVYLEGTFRTFDEAWRSEAHERIESIVTSIAKSMGAEAELEIRKGYPFVVNDAQLTRDAAEAAREYLGEDKVVDLEMRMTAEDFSYYSHELPGTFYRLGTANSSKGITSNLHTPTFNVDEDAISIGAGLMAWITLKKLNL